MRVKFSATSLLVVALFVCSSASAAQSDDQGRFKFSFDSMPFLGGSDKESDSDQEREAPAREEREYTYDAMGRKVPVRTE